MESIISIFTQEIAKEQLSLLLLASAFFGGMIASLAPCVLGLLPIIVGYVGGYSKEDSRRTFIQLVSFVFGMSLVLSFIGLICALSGRVLSAFAGHYWVLLIAGLLMIFGLNLLNVIEIYMPPIVRKMPQNPKDTLFVYPMAIGASFALASTPCSTPILASIMSVASLSENVLLSMTMLFLFALGQGLIVILIGVFVSSIKKLSFFRSFSEILIKISGILLILVAIFIYVKVFELVL